MIRKILLRNKNIAYKIKKSKRARRLRLAVYCNGNFVVTIPSSFQENLVEKFIRKKTPWILEKIEYFKKLKNKTVLRSNKKHYLKHKEEALSLVLKRVEHFNKVYNFKCNEINIKNQKTRWGSCSKKGNLNFNYKIINLPPKIADYIIVHEMCHLKEFNHSKKFWKLVSRAIPNYVKIIEDIKSL